MTPEQEKALTDLINNGFAKTWKNQVGLNGNINEAREEQIEPTLVNTQTTINMLNELLTEVKRLNARVAQLERK
jgi:hypothetical protein